MGVKHSVEMGYVLLAASVIHQALVDTTDRVVIHRPTKCEQQMLDFYEDVVTTYLEKRNVTPRNRI